MPVYILFGVSGCGKTSVGQLLSTFLHCPFLDADDFHPQSNKDKMASGLPLGDEDRWGWLEILATQLALFAESKGDVVLACSALKRAYRDVLKKRIMHDQVIFVYLEGSFRVIMNRMEQRKDHFMKPEMLASQFDTLEVPGDDERKDINVVTIDVTASLAQIHRSLLLELGLTNH